MKIVLLFVILLSVIFTHSAESRSDGHFEFNYPSFSHKSDHHRSSWSPFGKYDDNNDDNLTSEEGEVDSSTESNNTKESKGDNNDKDGKWSSRHDHREPSSYLESEPSSPIVRIEWGTIEGVTETHAGSNVSVFYGIPYAEPPVGHLRFRLPVRLEGHHRGIYNATTPKPACMQSLTGTPIDEPVSEDCLHMNIWVPRDDQVEQRDSDRWSSSSSRSSYHSHHRENSFTHSRWWSSHFQPHEHRSPFSRERSSSPNHRKLPVLFYIYGSQFKKHSSTYPMNRGGVTAAKGKLIFVSFNHRLQSFGFAYGGDHHMPGNQALYDILAALEWTRKNIADFGGDPDKITIAGSSAGSELAAMLALSPSVSPFLFDQVILMSAAPMRPTSIESTFVALNKTKALATKLGCGESSSHSYRLTYEQLECLQAANATDIAEADTSDDIAILGSCPDFAFMPIYGDDFMPIAPEIVLSRKQIRHRMKFMVGSDHYDDVETGNYEPVSRAEAEGHLDTMFTNMVKPEYNISRELAYLYDYYFDGVSDNDTWSLKERLSQLIGDNMFQCPLLLFIEKWATLDPVHYYYYNYTADAYANSTEVRHQHGPGHGSANWMFLGLPFTQSDKYSDRDRSVSNKMINILTNFVSNGDIPWPPMLVSHRNNNKVLPLEWVIDERVDTHNIKVNPKLDICRFIAKLYHVYF